MEKILKIDLYEQSDFFDSYNRENVSKRLIDYMIQELMYIDNDDTVRVIIDNKCGLEVNCIEMINNGLNLEYNKNLRNFKLTNIKQFILMIVGILFLFISAIIKNNFVFQEVFLIIGWVPIWEAINIELFNDIKDKRRRKILKKLLLSNFELLEK